MKGAKGHMLWAASCPYASSVEARPPAPQDVTGSGDGVFMEMLMRSRLDLIQSGWRPQKERGSGSRHDAGAGPACPEETPGEAGPVHARTSGSPPLAR